MKPFLPIASVSLSLLVFLSAARAESPAAKPQSSAPVATVLQSVVDHHIAVGLVGLVADGDKVLATEAAGFSNRETQTPMSKDAVFWIASMTKPITATALMMLVDEGKLKPGDPVEKYLPEFKGQMVAGEDGKATPTPPKRPITIADVLSHTSGLVKPNDPRLKPRTSLTEEVAQYGSLPLLREPGTKYEYNNSGINTAGRIIEVVSGIPYGEFIQKRLLDPLEMKDTTFWPTEAQAQRLARSARHTADGKELEEINFAANLNPQVIERLSKGVTVPNEMMRDFGTGPLSDYANHYAMPAGGLYSTAADVAKFGQMLLNGGVFHGRRLLSPEAMREMTTSHTEGIMVSPDEAYGLGFSVVTKDTTGIAVGSFGHRGARRTALWIDPTHHLVMVVMVARMDMNGAEQKDMYGTFLKTAVETYGSAK